VNLTLTEEQVAAIHDAVDREMAEAIEYAKNSPELSHDEFMSFVESY